MHTRLKMSLPAAQRMELLLALFVLVLLTGFANAGMIGIGPSPQEMRLGT